LIPHANEQPKGFGDADPPHDAVTPLESGGLASVAKALPAAPASVVPEPAPTLPEPAPVAGEPPEEPAPELVPASDPELPELELEPSGSASMVAPADEFEPQATIMGAAAHIGEK
jgi:hypothetical protein